jgi:hypothetical protein
MERLDAQMFVRGHVLGGQGVLAEAVVCVLRGHFRARLDLGEQMPATDALRADNVEFVVIAFHCAGREGWVEDDTRYAHGGVERKDVLGRFQVIVILRVDAQLVVSRNDGLPALCTACEFYIQKTTRAVSSRPSGR